MLILAQISDTHILSPEEDLPCGVDHNLRLRQAVEAINAEPIMPTAVLATGDMTNSGRTDQLAELQASLDQLQPPTLILPGNHDDQQDFRSTFDMDWAEGSHLSWSAEVADLRIVGLDVTVPGENHAIFDEEREQWLRDELGRSPDQPTAIAMHQPPFLTGIGWMDETAITNRDQFAAVLADFDCVNRIFCGHLHRPVQSSVAGVPATVGLSTIYHVALDLEENAPMRFIRDSVGYQLHCWIEGKWVTHTRYVDQAEKPFTIEHR